MSNYRCPLAKLIPAPMDIGKVKRDAWHEHRILVVALDDPKLDWTQREYVKQIGERLYAEKLKR